MKVVEIIFGIMIVGVGICYVSFKKTQIVILCPYCGNKNIFYYQLIAEIRGENYTAITKKCNCCEKYFKLQKKMVGGIGSTPTYSVEKS